MLIQCPSCHARTTLSAEEGAKVHCTECGRLFVASSVRTTGRPRTGLLVGVLVGALALIVLAILSRSSGKA